MLFSIIVPVYNTEEYLSECIESIISQSYKKWELILIDDGSTDSSSIICDRYSSSFSNIKVIHKKNEGVSAARKTGVYHAAGDYIVFVDSDDMIYKNCLLKLHSVIEKSKPEIIRFSFDIEDRTGHIRRKKLKYEGFYNKTDIINKIYPLLIHNPKAQYYYPTLWGCCFIKEKIKPFLIENSKATVGEDGACIIPIVFHAKSIYFINDSLYYYRYNSSSATKGHAVFNGDYPEIIANHIENCIDLNAYDFKQQLNRKIVHDVFNVCVSLCYQKQQYTVIKQSIINYLSYPFYTSAINNAEFHGNIKALIMHLSLKKKIISWIYIYSKLRGLINKTK